MTNTATFKFKEGPLSRKMITKNLSQGHVTKGRKDFHSSQLNSHALVRFTAILPYSFGVQFFPINVKDLRGILPEWQLKENTSYFLPLVTEDWKPALTTVLLVYWVLKWPSGESDRHPSWTQSSVNRAWATVLWKKKKSVFSWIQSSPPLWHYLLVNVQFKEEM